MNSYRAALTGASLLLRQYVLKLVDDYSPALFMPQHTIWHVQIHTREAIRTVQALVNAASLRWIKKRGVRSHQTHQRATGTYMALARADRIAAISGAIANLTTYSTITMNQKHDDQNKQADQTSSILDDDLQTEKTQQNTAKLDRDEDGNMQM